VHRYSRIKLDVECHTCSVLKSNCRLVMWVHGLSQDDKVMWYCVISSKTRSVSANASKSFASSQFICGCALLGYCWASDAQLLCVLRPWRRRSIVSSGLSHASRDRHRLIMPATVGQHQTIRIFAHAKLSACCLHSRLPLSSKTCNFQTCVWRHNAAQRLNDTYMIAWLSVQPPL